MAAVSSGTLGPPDPAGEEFTTLLGVRLLDTNLAGIQLRFGSAKLKETGDAGEYDASICYVHPAESAIVIFRSGELGGPEHQLLGFELLKHSSVLAAGCRVIGSTAIAASRLRVGPLWLGMSREAFSHALGNAEEVPGLGFGRVFTRQQPMTPEQLARSPGSAPYPFWDVAIAVAGEFRKGVLVRLRVSKTVTS
jgi:hypothetical protein